MSRHILLGAGVIVLLLLTIIVSRTLLFGAHQTRVAPVAKVDMDWHAKAQRLAEALSFKTVSGAGAPAAAGEFRRFHRFLETRYPRVHNELRRESVNDHSLLYTWQGSDAQLKPMLILAHMDVVPVKQDAAAEWTHPPFAGVVADDYIWGRGALDMKQSLMAIIESVEYLIEDGFNPSRTVYLAFGHDEEIGGRNGAAKIADLLQAREVQLEFTLDEGSAIVERIIPDTARPIALIGLAEKGSTTLVLRARGEGGHGSMPPQRTAVGKLAHAIHLLETNEMPARIAPPLSDMFEQLAPEMPILQQIIVANRWLFNSLLISRLEKSRATNAAIRTTSAMTMLKGGNAYNVMPAEATAVANFRILPGDTSDGVIEHVRRVIRETEVAVETFGVGASDASRVSAMDTAGFAAIDKTIRQIFPDAAVAPSLVVTGTDSKHYERISDDNYRLVPMRVGPEDVKRIHGIDERIGVRNYAEIIRFYIQFLKNSASPGMTP